MPKNSPGSLAKCHPALLAMFPTLADAANPATMALPLAHRVTTASAGGRSLDGSARAQHATVPPMVSVFVETKRARALASQGSVHVNPGSTTIKTALVPEGDITALTKLCASSDVQAVTPSRKLKARMDKAGTATHLPQFRRSHGLSGKGVIIGIIDSGLDAKHPAFAGRILRFWDQQARTGTPPAGYRVGAEHLGSAIRTKGKDDRIGHGTHVAGIAAGADPRYPGVAPDAQLIIVRTDFGDIDSCKSNDMKR